MVVLLALPACLAYGQNSFPATGNAGIGTTSPNAPLQVNGNSNGFTGSRNSIALNNVTGASNEITFVHNGTVKWELGSDINSNGGNNFYLYKAAPSGSFPFFVAENGNVGIGTQQPGQKLDVSGSIRIPIGSSTIFDGGADGSSIRQDNGGSFNMNASTSGGGNGNIVLNAASGRGLYLNFSSGTNTFFCNGASGITGVIQSNGSMGIGTTDPRGYKLAVAGSAIAESVTVKLQSQWPDYVFKPAYALRSINQTASYIKSNGHLPDMPSAEEIKEKGVDVGEMLKLQTKKIEELTLYLIDNAKRDQQKQDLLLKQQRQILKMKKELAALKNKITKL